MEDGYWVASGRGHSGVNSYLRRKQRHKALWPEVPWRQQKRKEEMAFLMDLCCRVGEAAQMTWSLALFRVCGAEADFPDHLSWNARQLLTLQTCFFPCRERLRCTSEFILLGHGSQSCAPGVWPHCLNLLFNPCLFLWIFNYTKAKPDYFEKFSVFKCSSGFRVWFVFRGLCFSLESWLGYYYCECVKTQMIRNSASFKIGWLCRPERRFG